MASCLSHNTQLEVATVFIIRIPLQKHRDNKYENRNFLKNWACTKIMFLILAVYIANFPYHHIYYNIIGTCLTLYTYRKIGNT